MSIVLLGPVSVDGASIGPPRPGVLAALAMRIGEAVSADRLADALWGERPPASWPRVVQGCVMRLRKALGCPGNRNATGWLPAGRTGGGGRRPPL